MDLFTEPKKLCCPSCDSVDVTGIEVRGVYDGVLYWSCLACGKAWPRDWTGYGRRREIADNYVAAHNYGWAAGVEYARGES